MVAVDRALSLLPVLRALSGPCPSDAALGQQIDARDDQVADALAFLEANGLIRIHREITVLTGNANEPA